MRLSSQLKAIAQYEKCHLYILKTENMKKGYECMNHNQIKSIVYNLIKKYETRNPVRLAKELDIIIQIGDLKKYLVAI